MSTLEEQMNALLRKNSMNNSEIKSKFSPAVLRFDGMYIRRSDSYYYCIRFLPDNRVIACTFISVPKSLDALTWDTSHASRGVYFLNNSSIRFSTDAGSGAVDYTGEILSDQMKLDSYSHINGFRRKGANYTFQAF